MTRRTTSTVARQTFASLLSSHLIKGTRPGTPTGKPWTDGEFASEVPSSRENTFVSPRSVSNWRKGTSVPSDVGPILQALFGPETNPSNAEAREALRQAFQAARHEQYAADIDAEPKDPVGPVFVVNGDQVAIDRTPRPGDQAAAADPLLQQLQAMIRDMAADLLRPAKRLANSRLWGQLPKKVASFIAVVDGDPLEMPQRLGMAYPLILQLGQFLETDIRIQRDLGAMDDPLDADIHALLTNLVRTAAPWLRGFPTIAAWDDEAGKALVRPDLFQPAREFVRTARDKQFISARDMAEVEASIEAAESSEPWDFLGTKAARTTVGTAKNLMLEAAGILATFLSGAAAADANARTVLARRAGATLNTAAEEVDVFAAIMPTDLRRALQALVKQGGLLDGPAPSIAHSAVSDPLPTDIEALARRMILEGHAVPAEWHTLIRQLDFGGTKLDRLEPLATLTKLNVLDLSATKVTDVSALSGLTALRSVNLSDTQVCDVTALCGLTALKRLDLHGTQVSDVSALAGLSALETIDLGRTRVTDVSPLSHLTELTSLDLWGTRVTDVSSLANLAKLETVNLQGTGVSNLSPLTHLTNLSILCDEAAKPRRRPPRPPQ